VTHEELVSTFGVKQQNGWKAIVSEFLTMQDSEVFLKLYEDVYAHPPPNGVTIQPFFCVVSWQSTRAT